MDYKEELLLQKEEEIKKLEAQAVILEQGQDDLRTQVLKDIAYALDGTITTKEDLFKFCYHRAKHQREIQEQLDKEECKHPHMDTDRDVHSCPDCDYIRIDELYV